MNINILDKNKNMIAIVDTYSSLMWCKRYSDIGALDLQIEATKENIALFKEGRYITRDDDDAVFVIRSVSVDTQANHDNHLIVGGVDIKSILNQRIVWGITTFKGNVEDYIYNLVSENVISPLMAERRIEGFVLGEKFGVEDTITQQVSYKQLDEVIIDVCKKYDLGWRVGLNDDNDFIFSLYRGVDRSQEQDIVPPVVFSPEYDNLASSKYKSDSTKFKNVALVGGEGEGVERKTISAGDGFGIDRYEMFVDNANSSTNTDEPLTEAEYLEQLKNKGESELAKKTWITEFEGEVVADSFKYKVDYDLGDTVTVSNEFGVTADAKIVEIVETWDKDGYSLEPIFEFGQASDFSSVEEGALVAENGVALMTNRSMVMLAETSTYSGDNGIKISELPECSACNSADYIPVVQNMETKKLSMEKLASPNITKGNQLPAQAGAVAVKIDEQVGYSESRMNNKIQSLIAGTIAFPTGFVMPSIALHHDGFLLCDGTEYNVENYPELSAILLPLPFNEGVADGKFRVPDLRKRLIEGANDNLGVYIEAGLPNITGSGIMDVGGLWLAQPSEGAIYINGTKNGLYGDYHTTVGNFGFDASKGETKTDGTLKTDDEYKVYGKSDTVQPNTFTINYFIKY